MSPTKWRSVVRVAIAVAFALSAAAASSSSECENILESAGDFYVLGLFRVCYEDAFELSAYVFAQAFRFSWRHGALGHGIKLGYKLVTYCEQPPGCPEKILKDIETNHLDGQQTVVTVINYGNMWPDSSKSFLVPKVEVFKNKISFLNTAWKINEQGALESLLTLLEQFQWNIVGVVHYYDQDLRNVITGFEQRDKEEVCLEFIEKKTYDGKRLVEKILSSASNVTIAIDTYYTTIDYMARAIESGQASPITGKQIVQCCTDTFFDFEDYAPAACQGMLALFQRPRQLSEFQDYLLGIGTQGLENTTLGYFYNLICHPCSAGSLSSMICRNYNTYITTDSMAGPAHTGDFKQCSSDICGDCLHRIAALDTIFMMHSLINTLAPAIEDMNNSHQPTIPQNTSSFDGVEFRTFLLNKYPQILPPNPNAFDVYYWNITADGGMAFVKVDVDLATGASKSYHPENRSVQTQDGGTITIVPSHCPRACQPGEKKTLTHDLPQFCCYNCEVCEPGTYSNGSAFEDCWHCTSHEWSHQGESSCWKKSVVYLFWTEPISVCLLGLSISGIALTMSVLTLHIRHTDTPIVKAAGGPVFYCSMASLICSFSSILLFFGEPTDWKCQIRRPMFGISFAVCLSSILAKSVRVLCAFASPVGRPTKLQASLYQIILGTGSALQVVITGLWVFLDPPGVQRIYPKNQPYLIVECFNETSIGFYIHIGYLCFLAFVCISVAIKGHALPKTFNDSQGISFMIMTFFAVWLSVMPVLDSRKEKVAEIICIMSIWLSSFSCLAFLFFQKCYIIIFKPIQNTPEWIKKSTFEYCQRIASKADLSIQLESTITTIDTST